MRQKNRIQEVKRKTEISRKLSSTIQKNQKLLKIRPKAKSEPRLNIIENHFYPEFSEKAITKIPKMHTIKVHTLKAMMTHEIDEIRGLKYIKDIIKHFWGNHLFNSAII